MAALSGLLKSYWANKMKVILSIGYGRLHLISSARYLSLVGCEVKLLCGWVPKNANGMLVKLTSKVIGRDLSQGFRKRQICERGVSVVSFALADFIDQGLRLFCRSLKISTHYISSFTWSMFGFLSKGSICQGMVFHCRSGAGQGGAIRLAKRRGIRVLVDHSALHPAKCEQNLREDYERWNQTIVIAPNLGVWKNVEKDCQEADLIMVNANHIKDSFIEHGYPPEKIRVVYLGVRSDFFGLKKHYDMGKVVRILYTGSFSVLKGAEYTLEAMRLLAEMKLEVQLDVYGSLDAPRELRDRYSGFNVIYHGPVPQDDLKHALASSDIYLFPSLADGCAQSGMEALAAGLPVVATYQSGLPITDGETGCLVSMKNAHAIADKIVWLVEHAMERERIGRAAAKMIAKNYTWEKYAENVKGIYEELGRGLHG